METFLNDAIVIEGTLLSFLLALFMTWLMLNGLFRVLPGTMRPSPVRSHHFRGDIQFLADQPQGDRQNRAA
jgi:hypothetical protein